MSFRSWMTAVGLALLPLPALALSPPKPKPALGQQLQNQVVDCIQKKIPTIKGFSLDAIQGLSMQCMFEVVILTPDGKVRPDANDRMTALVDATGIKVPPASSQGQATIALKPLTGSRVFTIPVTTANRTQTFLFDTGASTSLIDRDLAKQLRLRGNSIPDRLMSYMVVGEKCTNLNAAIYPLPELKVDQARVKGLSGLGLPKKSIPGQLSGVLGMDFLSHYDVLLNPQTAQLQLLPPSGIKQQGIPLIGKLGVMTVKTQINGKGPYTFALDTGADIMVLSDRLAKTLGLNLKTAKPTRVLGFCGTAPGKQITLNQVSIHSHQVNQLDGVILAAGPLDLLGVDGIIGQNFLNRFQQHWRFGQRDSLGNPTTGTLELKEL